VSFADILPQSLTTKEIVKVTELSCDRSLQQIFKKMVMIECWLARCKEDPLVSYKEVKFCWYLAQHNIVNVDFLTRFSLKYKYRNMVSTETN